MNRERFIFSILDCIIVSSNVLHCVWIWKSPRKYKFNQQYYGDLDATYLIFFINVWTIKGLLDDANEIWFQNQCDKILGLQDMF